MNDSRIIVKSQTGRDIEVRLLLPGDRYGRDNCLTWGEDVGRGACPEAREKLQRELGRKLGIEFTDVTDPSRPNFTGGRYYLGTILRHEGGLDLATVGPEWVIPAEEMVKVLRWILESL